jgi:hypothetical protein
VVRVAGRLRDHYDDADQPERTPPPRRGHQAPGTLAQGLRAANAAAVNGGHRLVLLLLALLASANQLAGSASAVQP